MNGPVKIKVTVRILGLQGNEDERLENKISSPTMRSQQPKRGDNKPNIRSLGCSCALFVSCFHFIIL